APKIVVAEGAGGKAQEMVWERLEAGHYECTVPLTPGKWMRGAVQVGKGAFNFGPLGAGTNPEWAFVRSRIAELTDVSPMSRGQESVDLTKIWQAPRRMEFSDLRNELLVALLCIFLVETLASRLEWKLPEFGHLQAPRIARRKPAKAPAPEAAPVVVTA